MTGLYKTTPEIPRSPYVSPYPSGMANHFGLTLRKVREGRAVSREWVRVRARELGFEKPLSSDCVKRIELGKHKPSALTLTQLRAIFFELPRS